MIREAFDAAHTAAHGKHLTSLVTYPHRRWSTVTTPGCGIIDNVLSNAMKYTPDGGRVTVTVTRQDGAVVCAVADTGIGIPTADQDRLFTRFDRTSNAIASGTLGTGLGLAVTKALVEHHHGTIDTPAAPTTAPPFASPYPHTSTARSDAARPPAVSHNC